MGARTGNHPDGAGYAVVDLETTGLRPSWHDRIVELGLVHLDTYGTVTNDWVTLVSPERDLGPQHIHRIDAADMRHAPTFAQIAAQLVALLRGRVLVAHNLDFDAAFLAYEFARLGVEVPIAATQGVCTMRWAGRLLPGAPRSLEGCCAHTGIRLGDHHSALADAHASAALLRVLLSRGLERPPWYRAMCSATTAPWPALPTARTEWVSRGVAAARDRHFLARIVNRLPRVPDPPVADPYLALLDRALLDRRISVTEADALVAQADELALDRESVERLHRNYLDALAHAAWEDGKVTADERTELHAVAALLGVGPGDAEQALAAAQGFAGTPAATKRPSFELVPGDLVVFTGEMDGDRAVWESRARSAGLLPHSNVTKKVRLVVAADPDSMSGKAVKARQYAIPIVTPAAFTEMIASFDSRPPSKEFEPIIGT